MAITLSANYLAEQKKGVNHPHTVIEMVLDGGTVRFGKEVFLPGSGLAHVKAGLGTVSSLQNKIDTSNAFSQFGQITFTIIARGNFKGMIRDEYLKNRTVNRYDGFVSSGFAWIDYAKTFSGKITNWSRKGDILTITVEDPRSVVANQKVPAQNATKTQALDLRNTNIADAMVQVLTVEDGMATGDVDTTGTFVSQRDDWLNDWIISRVITTPTERRKLLNELQEQSNSFAVHDGDKVILDVFSPRGPHETALEWSDDLNIIDGSLSCESGYKDQFFNQVEVYFDHDESGSDDPDLNYGTVIITPALDSQSASQWDEKKTKVIKSKWFKTYDFTYTANITGLTIYHVSKDNGPGAGTVTFNQAANTLTYAAPGGTAGEAVTLDKDGKYQIFDANKNKYVRVVVLTSSLPGSNQSDTVTITAISGAAIRVASLALRLLMRYQNPVSTVKFSVDMNDAVLAGNFIKPTDLVELTTDEAFEKGDNTWVAEKMMLTSVRPNFDKYVVDIEAIELRLYHEAGFVGHNDAVDYPAETELGKRHAHVNRKYIF